MHTYTSFMKPSRSAIRKTLFLLSCFVSITMLLSHLSDGPRMLTWMVFVVPLASCVMIFCWIWARLEKDAELLLRLKAGLVGGLLGTIGYDMFRIPFDIAGTNTLSPIRVYGLWATGSSSSTLFTDLVGFAYHLSNGITFGWIFALVVFRRHWAWAIVWGLMLETLAVLSPFGEVFAIRKASYGLLLAYTGHIWYGIPLGILCQRPERLRTWRPFGARAWLVGWVGNALVCLWFVLFQYAGIQRSQPNHAIIGPTSIRPTWSDLAITDSLTLSNPNGFEIKVLVRAPMPGGHTIIPLSLDTGKQHVLQFESPGIYQIQAPDHPWRSVFIAVHANGRYRDR